VLAVEHERLAAARAAHSALEAEHSAAKEALASAENRLFHAATTVLEGEADRLVAELAAKSCLRLFVEFNNAEVEQLEGAVLDGRELRIEDEARLRGAVLILKKTIFEVVSAFYANEDRGGVKREAAEACAARRSLPRCR
jgi:hypothetical protein